MYTVNTYSFIEPYYVLIYPISKVTQLKEHKRL